MPSCAVQAALSLSPAVACAQPDRASMLAQAHSCSLCIMKAIHADAELLQGPAQA